MSGVLEQPDASLLDGHHPNVSFAAIFEQASELCDSSWQIVQSEHNVQFFVVDGTTPPVIARSLILIFHTVW